MSNTTFDRPDLSAFTRLDDLGLEVTGQRMWPDHAVLACRIVAEDRWCQRCGCQGVARDTVIRRLAHEPYGWRPTFLHVSVRRYRCPECAHVWRQDMSQAADPRAKLSRAAVRWALTGVVVHHVTVARISAPGRLDPTSESSFTPPEVGKAPPPRNPLPSLPLLPGRSNGLQPGWPPSLTRGAATLRSSRWMDSPGLRAPPLKSSPTRGRSWIPSTSYTWPVMLSRACSIVCVSVFLFERIDA